MIYLFLKSHVWHNTCVRLAITKLSLSPASSGHKRHVNAEAAQDAAVVSNSGPNVHRTQFKWDTEF